MIGEKISYAMTLDYEADEREGVTMSKIGYCELKLMRQYVRGEKTALTPEVLLSFATGTGTHREIFRMLWKWRGKIPGFTYHKAEKEVELISPKGRVLKGHLDLDCSFDGVRTTTDLKVYDEGAFSRITEPHAHYRDQLMLYAKADGSQKCLLLYMCKSGKRRGEFKEFEFDVDEERVASLLEKLDRIIDEKAECPYKDPDENWECGYCQYYTECWGAKTVYAKTNNVIEIDPELEEEYAHNKWLMEEHKQKMEEAKEKIITVLGGGKGEGKLLSAVYIALKESMKYDPGLLRKFCDPKTLERCGKASTSGGYYQIRVRGEE
jgi:hypothetical protein